MTDDEVSLLDLAIPLARHLKLLVFGPLAIGVTALGIAFVLPPTFTARSMILPPQQSSASAAIGQLGALAGLAGLGAGNLKSPADQYVALMQSTTATDHLIDRFNLLQVYDVKYRDFARLELASNTRIVAGKKDGLITIEVDDKDPKRAADIANAYVDELRQLTDRLALSEAQQRRVFFEKHLKDTRDSLTKAQQALGASGINQSALKAEPKAAAENYARLRAELTAAEVKLQTLRRNLADSTAEVQQQQAMVSALRSQVTVLERSSDLGNDADYVGKYREFKYQETLFELFSRQYELARVDESREGALIQVVDEATPPERRSKPKRALIAVAATMLGFVVLAGWVLSRDAWRRAAAQPDTGEKINRLRRAFSWR